MHIKITMISIKNRSIFSNISILGNNIVVDLCSKLYFAKIKSYYQKQKLLEVAKTGKSCLKWEKVAQKLPSTIWTCLIWRHLV